MYAIPAALHNDTAPPTDAIDERFDTTFSLSSSYFVNTLFFEDTKTNEEERREILGLGLGLGLITNINKIR